MEMGRHHPKPKTLPYELNAVIKEEPSTETSTTTTLKVTEYQTRCAHISGATLPDEFNIYSRFNVFIKESAVQQNGIYPQRV